MSHIVPYELAKLRGNPGKRPLRPGPQPPRSAEPPEPLDFLSESAKAEWRRLAPTLHALNLLTVLDHAAFGAYCSAAAIWADAERGLESEGYTARGSTGNLVVHPLFKIAVASARDMIKFASEFGLTPCARARMRTGYDDDGGGPGSKFDGLLA
jgi:P27 family predicted phage terminase small subunit